MRRSFTEKERVAGQGEVSQMSRKAQSAFRDNDSLSVYEYLDYNATRMAEEAAEKRGEDYYDGQLDVIRYAINDDGLIIDNLTREELEERLEDYADAYGLDPDQITLNRVKADGEVIEKIAVVTREMYKESQWNLLLAGKEVPAERDAVGKVIAWDYRNTDED